MIAVYNLSPAEALADHSECLISAGLHPWYIGADWEEQLWILREVANQKRVLMIGEAGLDKLCKLDFELQQQVFLRQIELAEEKQKPLIIHCVKAWAELVAIRKKVLPSVPWIIHGFRGRPGLARQLLELDIYLSFGEKWTEESLRVTPLEKLCTETDESKLPIEEIYRKIAAAKNVTVEMLIEQANRLVEHKKGELIDIHTHRQGVGL